MQNILTDTEERYSNFPNWLKLSHGSELNNANS